MGGGGGNASNEALAYEQQRQAAIQRTQQGLERAFNTPQREADIQDFYKATQQYYRTDADRQQGQAARGLNFALARSGLTGGQYDADTNANLARAYQRGVLEADRRAQSATNSLRSADQQAKLNLFQLAAQGLDSGTAMNQTAQALRQNLEQTKADARENSLGDLFGSFGDIYRTSVSQDEAKRAQRQYQTLYQPSTYNQGFSGGRN